MGRSSGVCNGWPVSRQETLDATQLRVTYVTVLYEVRNPLLKTIKNVKRSHYRPGVAQRVGRGIALLFHDRGTRRG